MYFKKSILLMALVSLQSCVIRDQKTSTSQECCPPQVTAEDGRKAANRQIIETGYQIIRYDRPSTKTGDWDSYLAPFKEFGIDEIAAGFATKEFCDSYNHEMDRALRKRYGLKYEKLRSKILPPAGAGFSAA